MKSNYFKTSVFNIKQIIKDPLLLIVLIVIFFSLFIFILYPLFKVIILSFYNKGKFSLNTMKYIFSSWYLRKGFLNSLMMGGLTATGGMILGFLFAFTITRTNIPFKIFFHIMAIIPIISPPFIGALSIIMLFGNNGFITSHILKINNFKIYGFRGLLIAQLLTFFPVAYITLKGVLESINPTLEDAALDLGGSKWKVFKKVTLPLAIPGIASAMLVLFI